MADAPAGPSGLILCRDLFFQSKISSTARELGHQVLAAGNVGLASSMIEQWRPRVVFVDLAAGDLASPATITALKTVAGPGCRFIAFGSHVDADSLAAAKGAGCDVVLTRSQFTAMLPDLIRRHMDAAAQE